MCERVSRWETDRIDRVLSVLASSERRAIIAHLRAMPGPEASLEDLTRVLAAHTGGDRAQARIRLHHAQLPTLAATPIFEYDSHADTVRYHGDEVFESLLEAIHHIESETTAP